MKIKNIKTHIFQELKNRMPEKWQSVVQKFPKAEKWLKGEDYPTYNQLVEISKIFYIPFGYFFLAKLPERKYPIPHYRTQNQREFTSSSELLDSVEFAQNIQSWAREILLKWDSEKLPFCGAYTTDTPVEEIVNALKRLFDIETHFSELPSWTEAFKLLIDKAEKKGIFVLVNGVVGNNTKRKLDVKEFRGFVLYDEIAPLIFINNNDAISAKIFTLIHEVVHIFIGQSASFDLHDFSAADNKIEKFCDRCTVEFLVPEKELLDVYKQDKNPDNLARHFKVSKITILRRLLDIGEINQQQFSKKIKSYYSIELQQKKKEVANVRGGNFYNTATLRLSKAFLGLLNRAVESNVIMYRDALRLTGFSRKTYETLFDRKTLLI